MANNYICIHVLQRKFCLEILLATISTLCAYRTVHFIFVDRFLFQLKNLTINYLLKKL